MDKKKAQVSSVAPCQRFNFYVYGFKCPLKYNFKNFYKVGEEEFYLSWHGGRFNYLHAVYFL